MAKINKKHTNSPSTSKKASKQKTKQEEKTTVEEEIKSESQIKEEKSIKHKKIWSGIFITCIVINLIIGLSGGFIVYRMIQDAPSIQENDFASEESSVIYDDSGNVVTEVGVYLRENITYNECPESLVDAFLSIEDSRYFEHFGFDIPRFTKAAITNLKNRNFSQGGSTFTMQLVKNTYFTVDAGDASVERSKTIDYKVQQIYLAMKLDKTLSKQEIFQLYMNKLNFGGRIRGVQRAAHYYFGKDCKDLTLPESAMLAGIINLPNRYNPKAYLDYGTTRRNEVLNLMHYHGYINDQEHKLAKAVKVEDLLVNDHAVSSKHEKFQAYIDVVLDEAMEMTGQDPNMNGMHIYTHLNPKIQRQIDAIQNGTSDIQYPDELMQIAMISIDNKTGGIVGIGGGRNYEGARLLNRATMNFKQPGSAVKPVLSYALAFEYLGYTLDEILIDKPITYPLEQMVLVNYSRKYLGDVEIKDAVGNSLNIPAILTLQKVQDKIGKKKIVDYMNAIGFSRATYDNFHLSFAIGGTWFETTCKELAGANAMLVNQGVFNEPHTISKIELEDGTMVYPKNQNHRIISPGSAWMTCQLMRNNVEGPYFNWMQVLKRDYPVYAKTGTTDWGSDGVPYGIPVGQMKDKWMVASTSEYTNCVWVGYDMAIAGKETYYTSAKSRMNIPGNINRLLLDVEEQVALNPPKEIERPSDVTDIKFVRGTYPHVAPEDWMPSSSIITSPCSKTGLEYAPLVGVEQWKRALYEENKGNKGVSATYDQYGRIKISFANPMGICVGNTRVISLHDGHNDVDAYGKCLVDLSWLAKQSGNYYAKIYVDDELVDTILSTSPLYEGLIDASSTSKVEVFGGSMGDDHEFTTTVKTKAKFEESDEPFIPTDIIDDLINHQTDDESEDESPSYILTPTIDDDPTSGETVYDPSFN